MDILRIPATFTKDTDDLRPTVYEVQKCIQATEKRVKTS
jgi:hypothetical protein